MKSSSALKNRIAVVTGASRGIGKGIATALGAQGATVYVTGRTTAVGDNPLPGTIFETAELVTASGGIGVAVACDHADDDQVRGLFARVAQEHGHIDILVNNVTSIPVQCLEPPPFWSKTLALADQITVGLRSAYVSSYFAAPLLVATPKSLVVNISYYGAVSYHLDPAYGATKAGLDKMTSDMAQDFKPYGVSVISLWPGPTTTEMAVSLLSQIPGGDEMMKTFETPGFAGLVIEALYLDPTTGARSGEVVIAAEAALHYGVTDLDGRHPPVLRDRLGSPRSFRPPLPARSAEYA